MSKKTVLFCVRGENYLGIRRQRSQVQYGRTDSSIRSAS